MSSPNFQVVIEHGRIIGTYPMSITLVSYRQSISVEIHPNGVEVVITLVH